jgi:hypothetical protein
MQITGWQAVKGTPLSESGASDHPESLPFYFWNIL